MKVSLTGKLTWKAEKNTKEKLSSQEILLSGQEIVQSGEDDKIVR